LRFDRGVWHTAANQIQIPVRRGYGLVKVWNFEADVQFYGLELVTRRTKVQ
jgi:hypothetical protein